VTLPEGAHAPATRCLECPEKTLRLAPVVARDDDPAAPRAPRRGVSYRTRSRTVHAARTSAYPATFKGQHALTTVPLGDLPPCVSTMPLTQPNRSAGVSVACKRNRLNRFQPRHWTANGFGNPTRACVARSTASRDSSRADARFDVLANQTIPR
jgi:hypothetical protein